MNAYLNEQLVIFTEEDEGCRVMMTLAVQLQSSVSCEAAEETPTCMVEQQASLV